MATLAMVGFLRRSMNFTHGWWSRWLPSPPRALPVHRQHHRPFVGLVPSEHSCGSSRLQGSITKTGNTHVRRLLVEAAWHHDARYTAGKTMRECWELAHQLLDTLFGSDAHPGGHRRDQGRSPLCATVGALISLTGFFSSLDTVDDYPASATISRPPWIFLTSNSTVSIHRTPAAVSQVSPAPSTPNTGIRSPPHWGG
jgi:hypothetical protein